MADQTTSPTPEEIIAEDSKAVRARIAKRLGAKVAWSIAATENAVRVDIATALRPAPLDLPPRPRAEKPRTSPPPKTFEERQREERRQVWTAAELFEAIRGGQ